MRYIIKYNVFAVFSFEWNVKKEIITFCFINVLQSVPTFLEFGLYFFSLKSEEASTKNSECGPRTEIKFLP